MTLMLVSVMDAEEAALAVRGGADIVDFKDTRNGAIGALDINAVMAGVHAVKDRARLSAALGDPPYEAETLLARARAYIRAGVETLKLALDGPSLYALAAPLTALAQEAKLVGVLFADQAPDFELVPRLAALGFAGALLDTRAKSAGRLLTHVDVPRLEGFCARCRALRLTSGLAGSLEPPDVPRLLLTAPDILGFRGALCVRRDRVARLDPQAFALVRDLIPPDIVSVAPANDREHRARGLVGAESEDAALDRIFVRDFVIEAEIGAYEYEHGRRQRVGFDVEAWVRRADEKPRDMRAIFSYDVILDAIRLATAQGHHEFVESLAEAVAARVLRHDQARAVKIVLRKLDVIEGSVGVEIFRRPAAPIAL